jgi:hypothetical protein
MWAQVTYRYLDLQYLLGMMSHILLQTTYGSVLQYWFDEESNIAPRIHFIERYMYMIYFAVFTRDEESYITPRTHFADRYDLFYIIY